MADSIAAMPRVVAAMWSGPQGPAIVRTMARTSSCWLHRSSVTDGAPGSPARSARRSVILLGSMSNHARASPDRRGRPAHRGHDLRVVRQPDRAVPAQDARRPGRDRQPRHGGRDDRVPPRRRRSRRTWSGRSRRPATRSGHARSPRTGTSTASAPTEERTADELVRAREARRPPHPGGRLDRGRARDHGRSWPRRPGSPRWTQRNLIALVPATIVQVWAGRRFYRAAWRAARHGTATWTRSWRSARAPPGPTASC